MATDCVDEFREWEKAHNRDNYGRYDAFKAGVDWMRSQFELYGTDDCMNLNCRDGGRCTLYTTLGGRCLECHNNHKRGVVNGKT